MNDVDAQYAVPTGAANMGSTLTTGDNLVHVINRTTLTDSSTIAPKLPSVNGTTIVTPNLLVQRPRKTTS